MASKENVKKAQVGANIPPMSTNPITPQLDFMSFDEQFGGYTPPPAMFSNLQGRTEFRGGVVGPPQKSALNELIQQTSKPGNKGKGSRITTQDEYEGSGRYDYFQPTSMGVDNEELAAKYQSFGEKALYGVTKGSILAVNTFLQSTVGLVNGLYQAVADGRFASFYDNEFNRQLDSINKWSEDAMPNYYSQVERDAKWYSPDYLLTGNFLWDGVIKNLGFAVGAYASGGVFTRGINLATKGMASVIPAAKVFSVGKTGEAIAATEKGLSAAGKGAGVYGEVKKLSDGLLSQYNLLNPGQRALVAGLATTGEAGIESLHNQNEFRDKLIKEYEAENGVIPGSEEMQVINDAADGAGNASFWTNVGILSASNYIMFPRIGRFTYKGDKGAINSLVRETDQLVYKGGKFTEKVSKLHPILARVNKIRPYLFSVTEAAEEVGQYGASVGSQDYYNKKYNNEATSWLESAGQAVTKGIFSDQGAKNALIGGFSGAIMTGRGRYRRNSARETNTQAALQQLNRLNPITGKPYTFSDFTNGTIDAVNRAGVIGQEMEAAVKRGDELAYKNLELQYIINYLTPRIKFGRYDMVQQEIADIINLAQTEQGFAQLQSEGKVQQGDTQAAFIERMQRFKQTAESTLSLYQSLNLRYGGITEEGPDGKPRRVYGPAVLDKMLYTASMITDFDTRIPQLTQELQAALPGVDINAMIQDVLNDKAESFNTAVDQINNLDVISDVKDELGKKLNDVATIAKMREQLLNEYEDIKTNPKDFDVKPVDPNVATDIADVNESIVVKTKNGEKTLQVGQEYFVGQGVNFLKDTPLDEPVVIPNFTVVGKKEDGSIEIETPGGERKTISPDVLIDYKVATFDKLNNDATANFYFRHRNTVFEFNFGKNFGGKRKGRLQYDNGKLLFVYKDANGTILKKQLAHKFFVPQEGFNEARIRPVGTVSQQQKDSTIEFLSPEELAKNEQTLAQNRENRLKIMNDLGVESKRRLEEISKQLEKDKKKLADINKDISDIYQMREGGPRIKLKYSKAQKNFTRALNKLTEMQEDTEKRIKQLSREQEEQEFNISYFEAFETDLLDLPGNTGEFLQELKDQINLLKQNGRAVKKEISANNKLIAAITKSAKEAAKLLRSALETTYVFDQDYGDYMKELLDKASKGEDLLNVWPLLKQELANFNLTNDIQVDTSVGERGAFDAIQSINELQEQLESLKSEYKAKKAIVDRFQRIIDEFEAEQQAQDKLAKDLRLQAQLLNTKTTGPVIEAEPKSFNPDSKKSTEVLPRATVGINDGKAHQIRANRFGVNLNKFENRNQIRGVYVTRATQDQLLDGVVERILDEGNQELMDKFGDSIIVMVMIDAAGNLVDVNGQPIGENQSKLDNAIYQVLPESGFRDGDMFREGTPQEVKDQINNQYNKFRKDILDKTMVGAPFTIEASFGIPQYEKDSNDNDVFGTTSVVEADLISEDDLSKDQVIFIPTTNKNIFKGTVAYNQPMGSVFLDMPNGYVKLRNRKHTVAEAESIFDALYTLALQIIDPNQGATSDISVRMLNYLKGVTYWGIPIDSQGNRKDIGQNSVFFEKEVGTTVSGLPFSKLVLRIGPSLTVDLKPASIDKNKQIIIDTLGQMYNNVDNAYVQKIDQEFEQITSVSDNGDVTSIVWPNYQTYLLSKNIPGGGVREDFQLPLHTTMKPVVKGSEEVNREGVYFVNEDSAGDFITDVPPAKTEKPSVIKVTPDAERIVLDGQTPNTYTSPKGKKLIFRAPADTTISNYKEKIELIQGGDLAEIVEAVEKAGKDKNQIKDPIFNYISPALAKLKKEEAEMSVQISPEQLKELQEKRTKQGKSTLDDDVKAALERGQNNQNDEVLREVTTKSVEAMDDDNWKDVRSWMDKNLPQVPLVRVKNIIRSGGRTAWGMFQDNAMYVYENAEVGTAYHEAFEAVYAMYLDSNEIAELNEDFKARRGSFVDRPTGRTVKYKDATADQIREQLAEEFRDYIQDQKKPKGNFFVRLFNSLKKFIEGFFVTNRTEELFKRIDTGDFAQIFPSGPRPSYVANYIQVGPDAVFRVAGLSDVVTHDTIQHMTYLTLRDLIKNNESLFNFQDVLVNEDVLYTRLKGEVLASTAQIVKALESLPQSEERDLRIESTLNLMQDISNTWPDLIDKHKEYMLSFGVTFDEGAMSMVAEDSSNKGYNLDATRVDNFKKTNVALRLLMGTLPIVNVNENGNVRFSPSTINGVKLLPTTQVYITLLENLAPSTSMENMIERLRSIAINDPNYNALYKRITKQNANEGTFDFRRLTETHELTLATALWKTFKLTSPEVKVVNVLENGETVLTDANLSSAARQMQQQYLNSIVTKSKQGRGIFKQVDGVFNPDQVKLNKYSLATLNNMFRFLGELGIPFTAEEYKNFNTKQKKRFTLAVNGIKKSISNSKNIKLFSTKSLDLAGRLNEIATLKVEASNPEVSSTYFNIEGQRTQTHIGPNAASELHNVMTSVENKEELGSTPFSYLLTDVFSQGSTILARMYDRDGNLNTDNVYLFKNGYAGGILNVQKGTSKKSGALQFPDRLRQELNYNLSGIYMNLVPGDSSLEHTLNMGNPITQRDLVQGNAVFNTIMREYFISEVNLAREERPIADVEGRETTDLRFFKEILGEELHSEIKVNILDSSLSAEEVYDLHSEVIMDATDSYVTNQTNLYADYLLRYGVIVQQENERTGELLDRYSAPGVQGMQNMTVNDMNRALKVLQANYVIANIEMHKILYGDPYKYKDELKRTKSFLSPRQPLVSNSPGWNASANRLWNRDFDKFSPGFTQFTRDGLRTVTHGDVISVIDLPNYKEMVETDGGGIVTFKAYREIRIRANNWNDAEEKQYRYDIAYYKREKNQTLTKREKDLIKEGNPGVQSAYVAIKPIVSGARLNESFGRNDTNDVVLDKYSLYPLSYRVMKEINPGSNGLKLFDKMLREDIDYIIFESGRKVGAGPVHATYNEDGSFNDSTYENIINVPFNILSIQSEVPSKEDGRVTRASQITKLITLDLVGNSKPIDYQGSLEQWFSLSEEQKQKASPIYSEIKNNTELLDEMTKEGLDQTLKKLGITVNTSTTNGVEQVTYEVNDMSLASKTLREEIFKRETNDNISSALSGFLAGDAVLEATPAYNQVRNILYSIIQKNIVRPKISGRQSVQISSALFESTRAAITDINGKKGYTSDILKFYEDADGKRVMEVMVGRWFSNMGMTDAELLDYLNNTEEGQELLRGVAFRIPTQKQNSIDAIKIKQFLPKEFGDNVVVPSAIVEKVGSDFDIDKLFIYLKNAVIVSGKLQEVPFYGYGDQAKKRFEELYDSGAILTKDQQKELAQRIKDFESGTAEGNLVEAIFGETFDNQDVIDDYILELKDKGIRQTVIDRMYSKSLENEYIKSMENLITLPENFERLIVPNDASQLKALSEEIVDKTREGAFDYRNVGNLLDKRFMARLRNAFVQGKRGIGIAAVNQTNLALNQHSLLYINKDQIKFRRKNDVTLPDGQEVVSLSGIKNAAGDFISDINGQVIDGMVDIAAGPWIIELGITPATASTWLYLIKSGVPVDTVSYFMNQPIIRDYLRKIEESGYTWLFIDNFADDLKQNKYGSSVDLSAKESELLPFRDYLRTQVGKVNMSNKEKAYQRFILNEFISYAKQARDLFTLTQGTNWDTSTFNDPYLIYKKQEQLSRAINLTEGNDPTFFATDNNGNPVPAAMALIDNTFLKETVSALLQAREGMSLMLTSDQTASRNVLQSVLQSYTNLPDSQFIGISRRAVNSLFDYAVQTDQNLNLMLKSMLIDDNGTAAEVDRFVSEVLSDPEHPLYGNEVIQLLETDPSKRVGETPNNIKLRNNDRKVYEQNTIIYAFRQLKNEVDPAFYKKLVVTAILQSGLDNSPISFTSLIPYEDFQEIYNQTLSTLDKNVNLQDFYVLGMFERNNWNARTGIVPSERARWIQQQDGTYVYNPAMAYLPKGVKAAVASGYIPQVMTLSEGSRAAQSDYVIFNWNNPRFSAQERKEMAAKGDYSFINKGLFKKVRGNNITMLPGAEPFVYSYKRKDGTTPSYFVYKHINALGDGYRAQEYYTGTKPSVFDNGTLKSVEKDDAKILKAFANKAAVRPAATGNSTRRILVTKKGDVIQLSRTGGKTFTLSEIQAPMLLDLGYTEQQVGQILKIVCK
tara:strand:+ start:3121 stop:15627 length:12507 start_codon:yes stop_codon:yes gene_type:complete